MDDREKLLALRGEIDEIDAQMVRLFVRRMSISVEIARVKAKGGVPVFDAGRERQVLDAACSMAEPEYRAETALFMKTLMELSKARQNREQNSGKNQ